MLIELKVITFQVKNKDLGVNISSNKVNIRKRFIIEKSQILAKFKRRFLTKSKNHNFSIKFD